MMQTDRHINLEILLADKLIDWYADSGESETERLKNACKLMTNFLSNRPSSEIISASSAGGAALQFRYALDDPAAWERVEKEVNEMTSEDLDSYQFLDLVHYLCLCYS